MTFKLRVIFDTPVLNWAYTITVNVPSCILAPDKSAVYRPGDPVDILVVHVIPWGRVVVSTKYEAPAPASTTMDIGTY